MMYEERISFSDPARQLEYDLARHTLRLHYDSLQMIASSLLVVGRGGGAVPLIKEVQQLADRICADIDALEGLLPESLESLNEPDQMRSDANPSDAPAQSSNSGAEPAG